MFASPAILPGLQRSGFFAEADLYQARFVASLCPPAERDMAAAVTALLAEAVRAGHVCLDLDDPALCARLHTLGVPLDRMTQTALTDIGVITGPDGPGPLILHGKRLYFARFFRDERIVAERILTLASQPPAAVVFTPAPDKGGQPDWQEVALFAALRQRFCVISGGPGTGKTHTVARILHLAAAMSQSPLAIALAAPTGKAASRMSEALRTVFGPELPPELAACLTGPAQTVHRLLGWQPGGNLASGNLSGHFRYHAKNPLPVDLLVVDEVSMLDLELTARLLEAVPDHARLIFLGDRDQLASVEAGAVLANICQGADNHFSPDFVRDWQALARSAPATADPTLLAPSVLPEARCPAPLTDHVLELRTSWRFQADSGIARLSALIREGRGNDAARLLQEPQVDIQMLPCPGRTALAAQLAPLVRAAFGPLATMDDPAQALALFADLRLLSPVRQGPRGCEALNLLVREMLGIQASQIWYPGRPVMILENDYATNLFNGDTGIALRTSDGLRIFFPGQDGFRSFSSARLPRHETCYAMTVHKSQGSECAHALLVLPEEPCPVLSRELLYTALTRAKKCFTLFGRADQIHNAVHNPVLRDSGLGERLWPKDQTEMHSPVAFNIPSA